MEDIFDVTDRMRRTIPRIIQEGDEYLDTIKKRFLLMEKRDLVHSAVSHIEEIVNMMQTAVITLYMYYQNTHSEEVFHKLQEYIEKCEKLKSFAESLEENGQNLDKVQLVRLIEEHVKEEPKMLNNLLTLVELYAITEEENNTDDDEE